MLDPRQIKAASEAAIRAAGGETLQSLPHIGLDEIKLRKPQEVARRALVLHVLVNMSFGMPAPVGRSWLGSHGVLEAASPQELDWLNQAGPVGDVDRGGLRWNIEPLWAAAWTGALIPDLEPTQELGGELATLLPDLRSGEAPDVFFAHFVLRDTSELFAKRDLFYRAHRFTRHCDLRGLDSGAFHPGVVQQRRRLLEWVMDADADWDAVELST